MSITNTAKIYDAFAKHYREYSEKKSSYIRSVDDLIIQHFKGKVRIVFDFGAGDGVRGAAVFKGLEAEKLFVGDISVEMNKKNLELGIASEVWDLSNNDWKTKKSKFDLAMCLWNVLGHVPSFAERVATLRALSQSLTPNGKICFDVNNRHYKGYGAFNVKWRRFIDWVYPDYSRGDVSFDWKIDNVTYPAHGHLFTKSEIMDILNKAGLKIVTCKTVDYVSGEVSNKIEDGQLFLIVEKT